MVRSERNIVIVERLIEIRFLLRRSRITLVKRTATGTLTAALRSICTSTTAIKKLYGLRYDFSGRALVSIAIFPFTRLKTSFHVSLASFLEIFGAVFSL